MRIRRREISPIWRDVKYGTPSGISGGNYVMNDGEAIPDDGLWLMSDGGEAVLHTDDGSGIALSG